MASLRMQVLHLVESIFVNVQTRLSPLGARIHCVVRAIIDFWFSATTRDNLLRHIYVV